MTDFRTRPGRLKPGSLTEEGYVVDYLGGISSTGPIFIPADISPARKGLLGKAGWCVTPAKDWPSMLPRQGVACIHWRPPF